MTGNDLNLATRQLYCLDQWDGRVPFNLWFAIDWYTFPIAPLTPWLVDFDWASRSDPESGEEVTPCNLPVDPLNDAAGVGLFFLSLNKRQAQLLLYKEYNACNRINVRVEVFGNFLGTLQVLFTFCQNFFFYFFTFSFILNIIIDSSLV